MVKATVQSKHVSWGLLEDTFKVQVFWKESSFYQFLNDTVHDITFKAKLKIERGYPDTRGIKSENLLNSAGC